MADFLHHTVSATDEDLTACRVRPVQSSSVDSSSRKVCVAILGAALIGLVGFSNASSHASKAALAVELMGTARDGVAIGKTAPAGSEVDMSLLPADEQRKALGQRYTAEKNPHETGVVRTYDKMLSNGPFSPPAAKLIHEADDDGGKVKLGGTVGNVHLMRSAKQILAAQMAKKAPHERPVGAPIQPAEERKVHEARDESTNINDELKSMEGKLKAKMRALEEQAGSEELSGVHVR